MRCALQLLGDPQAAQEVVVRGLLQALKSPLLVSLSELAEEPALLRWLDRLVVNLCLSRLRENAPERAASEVTPRALATGGRPASQESAGQMQRRGPSMYHVRRDGAAPTSSDSLPAATAELMQLQRTAQALRGLSPETRITVILGVMQGRSLGEVAELLGCSETTCAFWLNHGRKLMRRALQRDLLEEDFEPPGTHAEAPPGAMHDLRRGKKAAARA